MTDSRTDAGPDAADNEGAGEALRVARRVVRDHPEAARKIAASDAPDANLWKRALDSLATDTDATD